MFRVLFFALACIAATTEGVALSSYNQEGDKPKDIKKDAAPVAGENKASKNTNMAAEGSTTGPKKALTTEDSANAQKEKTA